MRTYVCFVCIEFENKHKLGRHALILLGHISFGYSPFKQIQLDAPTLGTSNSVNFRCIMLKSMDGNIHALTSLKNFQSFNKTLIVVRNSSTIHLH